MRQVGEWRDRAQMWRSDRTGRRAGERREVVEMLQATVEGRLDLRSVLTTVEDMTRLNEAAPEEAQRRVTWRGLFGRNQIALGRQRSGRPPCS